MGEEYGIRCQNCDYKFTVNIGHGMHECGFLENDFETNMPMFYRYIDDKTILKKIESLRTKHNESLIECGCIGEDEWNGHGRTTYLCTDCSTLHTRYYFKLKYPEGEYEPEYLCPFCGTSLTKVNVVFGENSFFLLDSMGNTIPWKCPDCGGNELVFDFAFGFKMYD